MPIVIKPELRFNPKWEQSSYRCGLAVGPTHFAIAVVRLADNVVVVAGVHSPVTPPTIASRVFVASARYDIRRLHVRPEDAIVDSGSTLIRTVVVDPDPSIEVASPPIDLTSAELVQAIQLAVGRPPSPEEKTELRRTGTWIDEIPKRPGPIQRHIAMLESRTRRLPFF